MRTFHISSLHRCFRVLAETHKTLCSYVFLVLVNCLQNCKVNFYNFSVLAKGLNDGGRGFNIVIVDPKTKEVIRVGHFDTYAEGIALCELHK